MLDVLRFSSKSAKRVTIAVAFAALLTGCSTTTYENNVYFENDDRTFMESLKKQPIDTTVTGSVESNVKKVDHKTDKSVGLEASEASKKAVKKFDIDPARLSGVRSFEETAACRYLRKTADSEAIIVGSPTATASTDEDGSGSISIGMNLLDLRKAKLIRASGDAKCRLHEASKKIEATLGLGVEATKFAQAWAKQNYIRKNISTLNSINSQTNNLVQQGTLTVQDANVIKQSIRTIKADMARAKAEAAKGRDLPSINPEDVKSRHGALVEATNDLQNIEREIRTNDALEVSLNTGYRFNDRFNRDLQKNDTEGSFANVTVGVRLGALSAQRRMLEDEAASARLDALFEENAGTVWKSGYAKKASERMIADLRKSAKELRAAMRNAKEISVKLAAADRPEIVRVNLQNKVQTIRIGAQLASVNAAIKQLQQNSENIGALSQ